MPHKKTPRGYAKNYLNQATHYDRENQDLVNTVNTDELTVVLEEHFGNVNVELVIQSLEYPPLEGLILSNPQGGGVRQTPGKPYPPLNVDTFRLQMREKAYQKNGII